MPTDFAPTLIATRKLIELYGLDPKPMFKAHGIDLKLMRDPNARFKSVQSVAVWESFAAQVDDPSFGLRLAEVLHPSHLGPMGYAWLASTSLRTGFNRLVRYLSFLTEHLEIETREIKGRYSVITQAKRRVPRSLYWDADADLSTLMWMCRLNMGRDFHPASVKFFHERPADTGTYYKFFRCPIEFEARKNCLTFRRQDVDRELDTANPYLAQLNDQIMVKAIARLKKSKIVDRARAAIIEELPSGSVTDDVIAQHLHMSTRTFQRKLSEEGTTFKTVLTEVRQELGQKYIRNSALSLTEIAFLLGFSELSSFSSAYKRWVGRSPSEERRAA